MKPYLQKWGAFPQNKDGQASAQGVKQDRKVSYLVVFMSLAALFSSLLFVSFHVERLVKEKTISFTRGEGRRTMRPEDIKPWMTFAYIRIAFHLPVGYLENELHLEGDAYDVSTIQGVASKLGKDKTSFTLEVVEAVRKGIFLQKK